MPFAVELALDEVASKTIDCIRNDLAKQKITNESNQSAMHPHLTLAIYEKLDCILCEQELSILVHDLHEMKFIFSHFGIFTHPENVLFLAPTMTQELFHLHRQVHTCLANQSVDSWPLYHPDNWVPHCTLAFGVEIINLPRALDIALKQKLPMDATAISLGVTEFFPAKNAFRIPLKTV